jgi:hypothetical protein
MASAASVAACVELEHRSSTEASLRIRCPVAGAGLAALALVAFDSPARRGLSLAHLDRTAFRAY